MSIRRSVIPSIIATTDTREHRGMPGPQTIKGSIQYVQELGGGAGHGAEGGIPVPERKAGTFEGSIAWCTSVLVLTSAAISTLHMCPHSNPDIAIARCSAVQCFCFLQAA
jgi:hypothetical protein